MDRIHLILASSRGERYECMTSSMMLPSTYGSLGILANHAPMLCEVKEGTLRCRNEAGETLHIRVSDGIAHVADNELRPLLSHMEIEE